MFSSSKALLIEDRLVCVCENVTWSNQILPERINKYTVNRDNMYSFKTTTLYNII